MKDHKAPTEITIASTRDETAFRDFVQRYWKLGVLLAVVASFAVLARVWLASKEEGSADESWDRLRAEVQLSPTLNLPEPSVLARLSDELSDDQAGPWAKALEVSRLLQDNRFGDAREALAQLQSAWPDHPLASLVLTLDDDGLTATLPEHVTAQLDAMEAWEDQSSWLFENPPLPPDAPRVRIDTTAGPIVVGLYVEQAPKHCENFLSLCRSGFYDNTKFHRVVSGFMIQGGDPNSIDGDPSTWGQGGPEEQVDPELSELSHFPYVLAAAKKSGDTKSSGSQFYITTAEAHHLDGQHTVFGALIEGKLTVTAIEHGNVSGERPTDPVSIRSTEVLD